MDLNHRMHESKSCALTELGDSPMSYPLFISLVLNPTAYTIKPKTFLKDFVKLWYFNFNPLTLT